MFILIFKYGISKHGEKFIQNLPNCTFEELEQAFCKWFWIMKNDKEVYMQLWNIQRQTVERVEVYYEHMLKLGSLYH
jgi:hypothetical protein